MTRIANPHARGQSHNPLWGSAVYLRDYKPDDTAELIAVFEVSVRGLASADYNAAQIEAWAPRLADVSRWSERLGDRKVVVAVDRGTIVGFTDLESNGHIDKLFVRPSHARQGVATALVQRITAVAWETGLTSLHTEASITARPFFLRQGFEVIASQDVELRGQVFRNYRMGKPLD